LFVVSVGGSATTTASVLSLDVKLVLDLSDNARLCHSSRQRRCSLGPRPSSPAASARRYAALGLDRSARPSIRSTVSPYKPAMQSALKIQTRPTPSDRSSAGFRTLFALSGTVLTARLYWIRIGLSVLRLCHAAAPSARFVTTSAATSASLPDLRQANAACPCGALSTVHEHRSSQLRLRLRPERSFLRSSSGLDELALNGFTPPLRNARRAGEEHPTNLGRWFNAGWVLASHQILASSPVVPGPNHRRGPSFPASRLGALFWMRA
jgi:hypothetical protein